MASLPEMRRKGSTKFLETAFAFLHPRGFDVVDELQDLSLQLQELGASLAKLPVVVGESSHGGKVFGRRGDVLRPALATVAQYGTGVKLALDTVAGGFSTAAAKGVQGAGQKWLASQERLQKGRQLLLELVELPAEGTEVVGHRMA